MTENQKIQLTSFSLGFEMGKKQLQKILQESDGIRNF